jgi:hypothetical protein
MAASGNNTLPALARQIFYQARPKIMAMTDDKELAYGYFSQVLLPDYIEEHGVTWNVVYDARGHLEEPHTNRRIGVGTIEIGNYLHAMKKPEIIRAAFSDTSVDIIGPSGGLSGILFCEKEGFNPLFKAVNLANRHDLMIISTKGVSVTAARLLIDKICGNNDLPLFVLHDFDIAGFMILGTLHRDTRRYQFSNPIEPIDLGLRLEDIAGLEREPAAATKINELDLDNDRAGLLDVIKRRRGKALRASDNALSAILKDWGFTKKALAEGTGWVAPSLPELRDKICLKYPAVEWDDSVTEWGKPPAEAD